jgi:hypothetical protein
MNTDDDRMLVPKDGLSLEEIGHAGVKDISEIKDYRVRQEGEHTIHTVNFGEGSSLSITYSNHGVVVRAEPEGVRFERLGESLFVMKDSN